MLVLIILDLDHWFAQNCSTSIPDASMYNSSSDRLLVFKVPVYIKLKEPVTLLFGFSGISTIFTSAFSPTSSIFSNIATLLLLLCYHLMKDLRVTSYVSPTENLELGFSQVGIPVW